MSRTLTAPPAGWCPDPGHQHEFRYYDGAAWTDAVADHGVASSAPLPEASHPAPPSSPTAPPTGGMPTPGSQTRHRRPRLGLIVAILAAVALGAGLLAYVTTRSSGCSVGPSADLAACDLSGRDLTGEDLSGADLTGANLTGANLTGADLTGADLTGANLASADLSDGRLAGALLRDADLSGAAFAGAVLQDADLTGATADGTSFAEADLGGTVLRGLDLTTADLGGANLSGADLGDATLVGVDLVGARLHAAGLDGADLSTARLSGVDLTDADLAGARFNGADLSAALLQGVSGAGTAVFDGANLSGADLAGLDLSGASMAGAVLASAMLGSATLDGAVLTGADLSAADLTGVSAVGAAFDGAIMAGTLLALDDFTGTTGMTDDMLVAALGVPAGQLPAETLARSIRFDPYDVIVAALAPVRDGAAAAGARPYDGSDAFHASVVLGPGPDTMTPGWATGIAEASAPTGLRFAELVVVERAQVWETVEVCEYSSGGVPAPPITRFRAVTTVTILAASDGHVVAEQAFTGTTPRECQASEPYDLTELRGDPPDLVADAVPWVQSYVHPPV